MSSLPYSENRKEGVVPKEFVRAPRLGRICVETAKMGAFLPAPDSAWYPSLERLFGLFEAL
jgi:hypothetical protein